MPSSVEQLSESIVTSGLMPADDLKALWTALPESLRPQDGQSLLKLLAEQNKLTPFQAEELLASSGIPLVLGDYLLLAKIGAGGMGQVFKAEHRHMKRVVAIKLLSTAFSQDPGAIQRFQREVQAAAKLSHPNIVQAYDAGLQKGVWYLVMEYVEGRDLAAIIRESGPFSVKDAIGCMLQAARGLAFAHAEGVVHRDIKPANLLLDRKGTVKILDMGLARIDDNALAREGLTQSGQVMGTVDYMAPEQALNTRTVDHRADIYSLGSTLYRLLTGQNMYDGESLVQKLLAHQTEPIPKLAERRQDLSPELVAIFERLVAKKPEERFQSMAQVEAALAQLAPAEASASSSSGVQLLTASSPQISPDKAHTPTVSLASPLQGTDPVSERSIQLVKELSSPPAPPQLLATAKSPPHRFNNLLLALGGLGGVLLLFLGVWVIVRDKDGKEIAKVKVPEGGEVVIQNDGSKNPLPKPLPVGAPPPSAKAPFNAAEAKAHQEAWAKHLGVEVVQPNSLGMQMALIPPGEFLMGSSDEDFALPLKIAEETKLDGLGVQRIQEERPQHLVRITKPFRLGMHEVTIGQFGKFIEQSGYKTQAEEFGGSSDVTKADDPRLNPANMTINWRTPGQEVEDNSPVTQVSWNDAAAFCNWLSEQEKLEPSYVRDGASWSLVVQPRGYRLPTEAEWEYACRAGTTTQFWFGDDGKAHDKFGWSSTNASSGPRGVGLLPANPFGLYDMHGNVWEWCGDWHDGKWYASSPIDDPRGPPGASDRVLRGGSWSNTPAGGRSSYRSHNDAPAYRDYNRGFRIALSGEAVRLQASPAATPPVTKPTSAPPAPAKAPFDSATAKQHQTVWAKHLGVEVVQPNSLGMKLALIPPGEFLMGSSNEDITRALKIAEAAKPGVSFMNGFRAELPQHLVRITKPFRLGIHEVTIGQFAKFIDISGYTTEAVKIGSNSNVPRVNWREPGYEAGENSPVTQVSWNDAVAFCNWLSEQEKLEPSYVRDGASWNLTAQPQGYRLPTEAEWEYACRAGTTTQYSFGNDWKEHDKFGWSNTNAGGRPREVVLLPANPFGLHDMHGNVWEWCHDWYDGKWYSMSPSDDPRGPAEASTKVYRGGSWYGTPVNNRSTYRADDTPESGSSIKGFRVALSVE